jgi:uncharacterized membrane protein YdjX (TVP38/TMEM64 family)
LEAVTDAGSRKIRASLRDLAALPGAATRLLAKPRVLATVVLITALVAAATWAPLPSPVQMRDWAHSLGPWFPLAFLAAHIVVTILPFPRTAFTLAAGLLFGPVLGVLIAVAASTASAILAVLLVRAAGWQLNRLVRHGTIDRVDERLRQRGWPAILSLRLIPVLPFSAINYAAGASRVGLLPYTLATLAGLLPGTAAVVVLGDALAGRPTPTLLVALLITGGLGLVLLVIEVRQYRRQHRQCMRDEPLADQTEPAVSR